MYQIVKRKNAHAEQITEYIYESKKSSKASVASFPAWRVGMYSKGLLPLVKKEEAAAPPRMGSQPGGWEPVRARAVS